MTKSGTTGNNNSNIEHFIIKSKYFYYKIIILLCSQMSYNTFERALSQPRIERFLTACKGNKRKALRLYRLNVRLSQSFYSIIGIFEISLRNAIDNHYKSTLTDKEWLINSTGPAGIFSDAVFTSGRFETRRKIRTAKKDLLRPYTHDRLVAALSFGFWVKLFDRLQFRVGGKTLHQVFSSRPTGTSQKSIYKYLCKLRNFRNRIAHYEPICFNHLHEKDLTYAESHYELLLKMTIWLGYNPKVLFRKLNRVKRIYKKIRRI